jgi:hypothetical protein
VLVQHGIIGELGAPGGVGDLDGMMVMAVAKSPLGRRRPGCDEHHCLAPWGHHLAAPAAVALWPCAAEGCSGQSNVD